MALNWSQSYFDSRCLCFITKILLVFNVFDFKNHFTVVFWLCVERGHLSSYKSLHALFSPYS